MRYILIIILLLTSVSFAGESCYEYIQKAEDHIKKNGPTFSSGQQVFEYASRCQELFDEESANLASYLTGKCSLKFSGKLGSMNYMNNAVCQLDAIRYVYSLSSEVIE